MCDIVFVPSGSTDGHVTLFGKNSDRQRNETQLVEYLDGATHEPNARVQCTYIQIPQVAQTYGVLLCRPFWIWGAEMGANEFGVVIGNEGLHARSPAPQAPALIGMDLIRLALERARSAAEALRVITELLARHGQGGNCGLPEPAYYNNGFLIADYSEAFVLETVDREWLVERVRAPRSMSNIYSVGRDTESISVGLQSLVRNAGWSSEEHPCYADAISNPNREHIGHARARRARSASLLHVHEGKLAVADIMSALRDHGTAADASAHRHPGREEISICMHAGGPDRQGQTTGSMVSELRGSTAAVHWVTGTSAPCISIFKPVLIGVSPPPVASRASDHFDPESLWWRHECLHRKAIAGDFGKFLQEVSEERDAVEARFRAEVDTVLRGGSTMERARVVAQCWQEAAQVEERWLSRMKSPEISKPTPYDVVWSEMNRLAAIDHAI